MNGFCAEQVGLEGVSVFLEAVVCCLQELMFFECLHAFSDNPGPEETLYVRIQAGVMLDGLAAIVLDDAAPVRAHRESPLKVIHGIEKGCQCKQLPDAAGNNRKRSHGDG